MKRILEGISLLHKNILKSRIVDGIVSELSLSVYAKFTCRKNWSKMFQAEVVAVKPSDGLCLDRYEGPQMTAEHPEIFETSLMIES